MSDAAGGAAVEADGIAAREGRASLARASLSWAAGSHAVVGARDDGGPLLLRVIAGRARPRAGRILVCGGAPGDPAVRPLIAHVPLEPSLPDALRVDETLALAAALRGDPEGDAPARLAALGIEALAGRPVRSLSRPEARAVALAEALTSRRVRVLLVEEPLVAMDPRAAARLPGRMRARAGEGCAVVTATASVRDAEDLADDHLLLRAGAVVGAGGAGDALAGLWHGGGARLRVVLRDPEEGPALAAALARERDVAAVERFAGGVCARGRDPDAVARAAGRAAVEAGVDVAEIRFDPPSLDEVRARRAARPATDGGRDAA